MLDRIESHPLAARLSGKWLVLVAESADTSSFCEQALLQLRDELHAEYIAVLRSREGRWTTVSAIGTAASLPTDLLGQVLDDESGLARDRWMAAPLTTRPTSGELLVLYAEDSSSVQLDALDTAAALVGAGLTTVRSRERQKRRVQRLEAILEIASEWNQTLEMESLLLQMAETSTRLLEAERASIFLWDRPNKQLVGRPALGIESNELRIPEDMGVVGQVIQTGEVGRVDVEAGQEDIDRQIDRQLGYKTRTLLCVPLCARNGRLLGAFEMINKLTGNFTQGDEEDLVELAAHASIALENTQQYEQLLSSRRQMADEAADRIKLIGNSPAIEALRSTIRRVADTELAVLILGENGTGKEVVSQSIHYLSSRRDEPFVAVNCAALTETLLESELFGHEKGAFTDAHEARAGKFELASGGSLFLDEIGDLSLGGQSKLLRVLEDKNVIRVGGSLPIQTDTRVIAATNQDLAQMVREKKFREDLYFRLNVVTLELPPLRERAGDVLLLAEHFLQDFCVQARRKTPKLTPQAKKRLREHLWPGNIRELRNLMERLAYLTQEDTLDVEDIAFILSPSGNPSDSVANDLTLIEATSRFQTEYIKKNIESTGGNMSDAARRLGLHRSNLYRKMRQLGMGGTEKE